MSTTAQYEVEPAPQADPELESLIIQLAQAREANKDLAEHIRVLEDLVAHRIAKSVTVNIGGIDYRTTVRRPMRTKIDIEVLTEHFPDVADQVLITQTTQKVDDERLGAYIRSGHFTPEQIATFLTQVPTKESVLITAVTPRAEED